MIEKNKKYVDPEELERKERADRFAKIWWKSRANMGVSQEYMALGLGVSRKTIQNWERGVSAPSFFQGTEWFRVLGVNPLPYYFAYVFPEEMDGIKGSDSDDKIDKALKELIDNLPRDGKRRLLYMLYGSHGSSPRALLNLINAHLQTPLKDRIVQAAMIVENYEIEKELGNIVSPENIQPDIDMVKNAMNKARDVVRNHQDGYMLDGE